MKSLLRIAFALGLAVMVALIVSGGARAIMNLLAQAGWLLLILIPFHTVPLLLDVLGWRALMLGHVPVRALFLIAWVREAINRLLPVANVGGEIVGIRLLAKSCQDGPLAAATVVVETLLTLVSQYLFFLLGILSVWSLAKTTGLTDGLLLIIAAGPMVIVLLAVLLHKGSLFTWAERLARRVLGQYPQASDTLPQGSALDHAIRKLLANRACLTRAVGWQFAGLVVGCTETWLALRFLGHPVRFTAAVGLESVTQAARSFAFMIPAGLGVQEAGLMALGHVLGLGSDVAIALSLAKRMREIVFGVPGLGAWQWMATQGFASSARSSAPSRHTISAVVPRPTSDEREN